MVYQWQGVLVVEHAVDIIDDLTGVVIGNLASPACPNALCTIY